MKAFTNRLQHSPWVLAVLGGALLGLTWLLRTSILLPVALLPWFALLEHQATHRTPLKWAYLQLYVSTIVWNGLAVWWIAGATMGGMLGAVFTMAALMAVVLTCTLWAWRLKGRGTAMVTFLVTWVAFEYFFHNSEITWPWLSLGNGWANGLSFIQWYEYTGMLGGTVWTIAINVALYGIIANWRTWQRRGRWCAAVGMLALIAIPTAISLHLRQRENAAMQEEPIEVAILQPSIDPWNEKFESLSSMDQVRIMLRLADSVITPRTQLIVTPETSIPAPMWESELNTYPEILSIREFLRQHPQAKWLAGASPLRLYPRVEMRTPTARQLGDGQGWYDAYNAALLLDTSPRVAEAIKSKLVVGVEMLPYPEYFRFLESASINLGGLAGSLGTEPHRRVFTVSPTLCVAPIICWESVFGEYCTEYVRRGANVLAVITNDAWWGNTPGLRHHLSYAQLRCIEVRRDMVRSANTGISACIDRTGRIMASRGWWERSAFRAQVRPNRRLTFYAEHGDYLGRIASGMTLLVVLHLVVQTIIQRRRRRATPEAA